MPRTQCAVCGRKNARVAIRCSACGADFHDPDATALLASRAAGAPDRMPEAAGALASSRILGLSFEPTHTAASLRKLAAIGAVLLLAAFFIPMARDYARFDMAWSLLDIGSPRALLLPPVAAALGLFAALLRPLAIWQRAALLAVPGAIGLVTLSELGRFAGTPHTSAPLFLLGLTVAGTALMVRLLRPTSRGARHGILAGAALALLGQLVPVADPAGLLPVELLFYQGEETLGATAMPVAAPLAVLNRDVLVFWVCAYLLLPLALLPAAALTAWPRPRGIWDPWSMPVRALAWLVILYVPLGFALYVFDMMGWGLGVRGLVLPDPSGVPAAGGSAAGGYLLASRDELLQAAIIGRTRLGLLATVYALWLQMGLATLYMYLRPDEKVPHARIANRG